MVHALVVLFVLSILVEVGRRIFVNSAKDTGVVRFRGYIFLCFIFSLLLYAFTTTRDWGYLCLFFLFIFFVLMLMRYQTSKSTKDRFRESVRNSFKGK